MPWNKDWSAVLLYVCSTCLWQRTQCVEQHVNQYLTENILYLKSKLVFMASFVFGHFENAKVVQAQRLRGKNECVLDLSWAASFSDNMQYVCCNDK